MAKQLKKCACSEGGRTRQLRFKMTLMNVRAAIGVETGQDSLRIEGIIVQVSKDGSVALFRPNGGTRVIFIIPDETCVEDDLFEPCDAPNKLELED